jgi:hypothetical protein
VIHFIYKCQQLAIKHHNVVEPITTLTTIWHFMMRETRYGKRLKAHLPNKILVKQFNLIFE